MDLRQEILVVSCGSTQSHSQSEGSHYHIIVNYAVSTAETALPPIIIFEKAFTCTAYDTQGPITTCYAKSSNGFMDEWLFYSWFSKLPQMQHLGKRIYTDNQWTWLICL